MRGIEEKLLDKAQEFELIDSIGKRELERVREDRNLCVHPSLRSFGGVYQPRPETAHGHFAGALATLLTHAPIQGRKVLAEFTTYICDPAFVSTPAHIQSAFSDRVRSVARHTRVDVAAKHAVLELELPLGSTLSAIEHADRMASALVAFALRDRELVRAAVTALRERFQPLEGSQQLRALARLGDQDYFWSIVDEALEARLHNLLDASLPDKQGEPLPSTASRPWPWCAAPTPEPDCPSWKPGLLA